MDSGVSMIQDIMHTMGFGSSDHFSNEMTKESGSRIRQRSAENPAMRSKKVTENRLYQLHFSCEYLGRYFRSSKRRITWEFGVANCEYLRQGQGGANCRGANEHKVELVWSVKSGKTQVVWNGVDISRQFGTAGKEDNMVHFAWKTTTGETLQILAFADDIEGHNQYELFVDGASFSYFPSVEALGSSTLPPQHDASHQEDTKERKKHFDVPVEIHDQVSDLCSSEDLIDDDLSDPLNEADFRLSMVGLRHSERGNKVVDELHSELYSPMLETLRHEIAEFLPQLEDMVSRAIINAFFVDSESMNNPTSDLSSSSSDVGVDPHLVEANALHETYDWMKLHEDDCSVRRKDDLRLSFMQKQIDKIFVHVRNEQLTPEQAARVVLSVGALLSLQFAESIPCDTVVFPNTAIDASPEFLYGHLMTYGVIEALAISEQGGFAFCRFEDNSSACLVIQAARQNRLSCIEDFSALPFLLTDQQLSEVGYDPETPELQPREDMDDNDDHRIPPSPSNPQIPHLMAPLPPDFQPSFPDFPLTPPVSTRKDRPRTSMSTDRTCSLSSATGSDCMLLSSPHSIASIVENVKRSSQYARDGGAPPMYMIQ